MNQPSSSQVPVPNEQITGSTIVAIISMVLAAGWIAFAYYNASGTTDENGKGILLLHPIVPILLMSALA